MDAAGIIPPLDELENGQPCFSPRRKLMAIEELTFERGEEAPAHRLRTDAPTFNTSKVRFRAVRCARVGDKEVAFNTSKVRFRADLDVFERELYDLSIPQRCDSEAPVPHAPAAADQLSIPQGCDSERPSRR